MTLQDDASASPPSDKLSGDCLKIVQDHTVGAVSFAIAVARVSALVAGAGLEELEREQTIATYVDMLHQHELRRASAERRSGGGAQGGAGTEGAEATPGGSPNASTGGAPAKPKRARVQTDEGDAEQDAVDDDTIDDLLRTRKVARSDLPWAHREPLIFAGLSPSLRKTRDLLDVYSGDPKRVLYDLLASPGRPDVPNGIWTAILAGRAVNLDDVLACINSIEQDTRHFHDIGDFQLSIGAAPSAAKAVRTAAEWQTAWERAAEAVLHAFPHRASELADYGRYIRQLFAALATAHHDRVINFDRAVRNRVAATGDLLLTDFHRFTDLQLHWVTSAGAGVAGGRGPSARTSATSGSNPTRGKKGARAEGGDACRRWNNGACPDGATCRFPHACSECGGKHTRKEHGRAQ
jgi:hypothetical protein